MDVYELIDRCAADMISVHAVGGTYMWASSSTERLFGWSPEELVGRSVADVAHPDDRERVTEYYSLSQHSDGILRFRFRDSEGAFHWVETRTQASQENGDVQLVSVTRDVYMKPRAERSDHGASGLHEVRISPLPRMGPGGAQKPSVLVVDDQPEMRQLLEAMLRQKYRVLTAADGAEALEILKTEPVMAVVSDVMMPRMSGDQLLREIRRDSQSNQLPVLLVTARTDRDFRTRVLRDGATDCVTKPFDRNELIARIDNLVHSSATFRKLRQQTRIDPLTGLFNRGRLMSILHKQHELSVASDYDLSVVMVDVDRFKRVNDTHGHPVGDEVLQEVSRRLVGAVRSCDAVGRYGGEEFLVVLPSCGYAQALAIAEALHQAVRREPVQTAAGPLSVTVSGGVSTSAGGCLGAGELVEAADRALYRAKRAGRDRVAA